MTVALLFANSVVNPVQAADTANETRAISQQVLALIKTSNLDEAETLAKRGLLLCEDAGDVKVFCVGQFNDSLGDIAYARSEYSSALAYYEQALRVREAGLGNGHLLTTRSQLRVGKAHMALHRGAEAEGFVKRAVAGFEKVTPVNRELAIALGYLRNIYLDVDRIDDAVIIARRELDAYEKVGDKETTLISNTKRNLASILSRQAAFFFGQGPLFGRRTDPHRGGQTDRSSSVRLGENIRRTSGPTRQPLRAATSVLGSRTVHAPGT